MAANRHDVPGNPPESLLLAMDRDDELAKIHREVWAMYPRRFETIEDEWIDINARSRQRELSARCRGYGG